MMDAERLTPVVVEVLAPSVVGAGASRLYSHEASQEAARPGAPGGEEAYRLWQLLDRLRQAFGNRIVVHLIEPLSIPWIVRVIRYRPRRYPAFVVAGRMVISGLDENAIAQTIATLLGGLLGPTGG